MCEIELDLLYNYTVTAVAWLGLIFWCGFSLQSHPLATLLSNSTIYAIHTYKRGTKRRVQMNKGQFEAFCEQL